MRYRKTWRHEVIIEADSVDEAKNIWGTLNLGKLDNSIKKGGIVYHEFVENVSFEDEDYEEIDSGYE